MSSSAYLQQSLVTDEFHGIRGRVEDRLGRGGKPVLCEERLILFHHTQDTRRTKAFPACFPGRLPLFCSARRRLTLSWSWERLCSVERLSALNGRAGLKTVVQTYLDGSSLEMEAGGGRGTNNLFSLNFLLETPSTVCGVSSACPITLPAPSW